MLCRKLPEGAPSSEGQKIPIKQLGRQLCQHVVGMNPEKLGDAEVKPHENTDEETAMIHQEFLLDITQTVGQVLTENGVEVLDFARFECGEELKEEEEVNTDEQS